MKNFKKSDGSIHAFEDDYEGDKITADMKAIDGKALLTAQTNLQQAAADAFDATLTYADRRRTAYPPMADCLDALVKGDEKALQGYKDACLAIKKKFPKP